MISIRPERPEDVAAIRAVNETAFGGSAEDDIVDTLRLACPDVLFLVALSDETLVSHIFFSPVKVEGGSWTIQGMGLPPMAVLPVRQRQGIGSRLVEAGLQILRKQGCPFIIVLGHPGFYPRFSFVPASWVVFTRNGAFLGLCLKHIRHSVPKPLKRGFPIEIRVAAIGQFRSFGHPTRTFAECVLKTLGACCLTGTEADESYACSNGIGSDHRLYLGLK